MAKKIEICHFNSFDALINKTEELQRYFQAPAKPDEHYKLVFKKKRDAQVWLGRYLNFMTNRIPQTGRKIGFHHIQVGFVLEYLKSLSINSTLLDF